MEEEPKSFWDGVSKEGKVLDDVGRREFVKKFVRFIRQSPEFNKLFFNTQVYNVIENDVTTRGEHSVGVSIVSKVLAELATQDGTEIDMETAGLLAECFGFMHDLGHTPFGHDGEGALNDEMDRFEASEDYKSKRKGLFGNAYVEAADDAGAISMCYEHNETSAVIAQSLLEQFAEIEEYEVGEGTKQYLKTGILAHSTSRVKKEPEGLEQKAVRLADKVAYIPQDLLDLLKQGVIKIGDLSPEERGLIGLNPDDAKDNPQRVEDIRRLVSALEKLDTLDDTKKHFIFGKLDSLVKEMQVTIASKCVTGSRGDRVLDGKKQIVDEFDKWVNKGESPDGEISERQTRGKNLFTVMRYAQKGKVQRLDENGKPIKNEKGKVILDDIPEEQKKEAIDRASANYRQFLIDEYGLDPMVATLWVTKAKYQDAFINGELKRETPEGKKETLGDINHRHDNAWKMKSTFQFFFCNPEMIPADFRAKYDGRYTEQQIVSAFLASFTNQGLNDLFENLHSRGLVMERREVMEQLAAARPDLDIEKLAEEGLKFTRSRQTEKADERVEVKVKISGNDVLEELYEKQFGKPIVSGKKLEKEDRQIPEHREAIAIRDKSEALKMETERKVPSVLSTAIDVSKTVVDAKGIRDMVSGVREKQQRDEVQPRMEQEQMQNVAEQNAEEGR